MACSLLYDTKVVAKRESGSIAIDLEDSLSEPTR